MLEWPRSAFMPPPRMPMLPRMSCSIAMVRMFCEPLECCVQPSAYIDVIVLVGVERLGDHLGDLQELVLRRAADALDHLGRVARDVLPSAGSRRSADSAASSSTLTKPSSPIS